MCVCLCVLYKHLDKNHMNVNEIQSNQTGWFKHEIGIKSVFPPVEYADTGNEQQLELVWPFVWRANETNVSGGSLFLCEL